MNVALPSARCAPVNVLAICAGVGGLELGLQLAHHHRGQAGYVDATKDQVLRWVREMGRG